MVIKENQIYHVKDAYTGEDVNVSFTATEEVGVWLVYDEYWDESYILDEEEIIDCFIF